VLGVLTPLQASEFELSEAAAELELRNHNGDAAATLRALLL
jgi:hypothetical protein